MIEIWKDKGGEWRFTVKGRNGEVMATSEGYTRPEDAERGAEALRRVLNEAPPPVVR